VGGRGEVHIGDTGGEQKYLKKRYRRAEFHEQKKVLKKELKEGRVFRN
jgi:hypothetical protein